MLTARSFAARHGYAINANHEFVAPGVSNLAAGISQGFAISGADSRTAVNDMVGGKSQLVGIIAALVIALILLFFTAPMAWIPQAALGAVLLMAGWGLIDIKSLKTIRTLSRFEFWLCLLTTVGVLGLGVLPGIVFAVTLAILRLLYSIYQPTDAVLGWLPGVEGQVDVRQHKDARTVPGLVVYRFDDAILFFNADYFKMRLLDAVQGGQAPGGAVRRRSRDQYRRQRHRRPARATPSPPRASTSPSPAPVAPSCACWCARGWRGRWRTTAVWLGAGRDRAYRVWRNRTSRESADNAE
jgi:MFS superfamily sulfate permease-like transporter